MAEAHAVPGPARERILEAAERVVAEVGAARLTLDLVAQAAGVSKGGLLYHFPSKESLLGALAQRYVQSMEQCIEAAKSGISEHEHGRDLKACIVGILGSDPRSKAMGAALLATAANDLTLLEVIRERLAALQPGAGGIERGFRARRDRHAGDRRLDDARVAAHFAVHRPAARAGRERADEDCRRVLQVIGMSTATIRTYVKGAAVSIAASLALAALRQGAGPAGAAGAGSDGADGRQPARSAGADLSPRAPRVARSRGARPRRRHRDEAPLPGRQPRDAGPVDVPDRSRARARARGVRRAPKSPSPRRAWTKRAASAIAYCRCSRRTRSARAGATKPCRASKSRRRTCSRPSRSCAWRSSTSNTPTCARRSPA